MLKGKLHPHNNNIINNNSHPPKHPQHKRLVFQSYPKKLELLVVEASFVSRVVLGTYM
jgi:hypothetical protein